jgi:acyl dehydratase
MPLDPKMVGRATEPLPYTYTWRDTVLYALGVGARRAELEYLYEGRGPKVLAGFAVVPTIGPIFDLLGKTGGSIENVVHGAQKITLHAPLAPSGTLSTVARVKGLYDLRRFAIAHIETETRDEHGKPAFDTLWTIIYRDEGGFGGDPPPRERSGIDIPKDRPADFRISETTSPEQALLYRLSGDLNPLHADPEVARRVGFEQGPILHGLCTYGHMTRHAATGACGGDSSRLTGFGGSFKKPVWPGDTLVTLGWVTEPGKVALAVSTQERGEVVIGGAWATYSL